MAVPTHSLHIPIATNFSMPRIQNVLSRLARDPLAAALPPVAWFTARELHHSFLPLHLKTNEQVEDAIQLLGSPRVRGIVHECGNTTAMSSGSSPSASTVTLHGLKTANVNMDDIDKTAHLAMYLKDCTLNFKLLQQKLIPVFRNYIFTYQGRQFPVIDSKIPFVEIMTSKFMRTDILRTTPPSWLRGSQPSKYRKPLYDARDLYIKYKDHTWIKDLELETLSLSQTGVRDIIRSGSCIGQGFLEIARIPLPGITEAMLEPQDPHDRYIGAKKSHEEKMPVKPLWLSLRPQDEAPDLTPKSILSGAMTFDMT